MRPIRSRPMPLSPPPCWSVPGACMPGGADLESSHGRSDPSHVREARVAPDEGELDDARRAIAVLRDLDLRGALEGRFGVVDLVSVDEHHDVRVLLDRAGLAQVGEHRALVGAAFETAGELAQRDDGNLELAGEDLQPAADLGDL